MKSVKLKLASILCLGLLAAPVAFANIGDLEEEMIEADMFASDSEAALQEARETKKLMAEEAERAKRIQSDARAQIKASKAIKAKAERDIVNNEKKISRARKDIAKAEKDLAKTLATQKTVTQKHEKTLKSLVAKEKQLDTLRSQLKNEKQKLKDLAASQKEINKRAQEVAKNTNRTKKSTRNMRSNVRKAYANKANGRRAHIKMINKYEDSLRASLKELEELRMLVETDQEFDQKLAKSTGKDSKNFRTISGLNAPRNVKIVRSRCNVRAYPSLKGKTLGSYRKGKKLRMRYHNKKWFTMIYSGKKAFISQSCFG